MPLYSYLCSDCGAEKDEYRRIDERNNAPDCDACKITMVKTITAHKAIGDLEPYYDDNLETYIKSKRHRRQVMRSQDVDEKYGKGWN